MFEKLKKRGVRSAIGTSIIIFIIGGVLLILFGRHSIYAITGYEQFEELGVDEIKNQCVDVTLYQNYGCYLTEYEKKSSNPETKDTGYYYVIYTGSYDDSDTAYKYMTIKVDAKYGDQMDVMTDDTYEGYLSDPMLFSGEIRKLSDKEYEYFYDFWQEIGLSDAEIMEQTLPYYINAYEKTTQNVFFLVISLGALVLILWGIIHIIKATKGSYLNKFKKDLEFVGANEASVASDFETAQAFNKRETIKVGRQFIYFNLNGVVPRAIATSKIYWAYYNVTVDRHYGIKTGTTHFLVICAEGYETDNYISMDKKEVVLEILDKMEAMFPWIVVGYTDELHSLYYKDESAFMNLKYNTIEHIPVESYNTNITN